FIPSNDLYNAVPLFDGIPNDTVFPWDDWFAQRPPKDPKWTSCYLHLGPAQDNANSNWIVQHNPAEIQGGIPIHIGQSAQIRLLQVVALDRDGHVMKVPFHISFYGLAGVNVASMPHILVEQVSMFPPYAAGQSYPFVRDGFEEFKIDGTKVDPNVPQPTQTVALIRAYGTFYEKAGFWPGSYSEGDEPTGLLVDETPWEVNPTAVGGSYWDPYKLERNLTNTLAAQTFAMIYCDAQGDQDVYFVGRMFRAEPGTGA
ncbi:MAG TPA: hypothetical protein VNN23_06810, partial [Ornithinibacter sp.]|nr:hypothetical protein [Ornithinibacter sp.]